MTSSLECSAVNCIHNAAGNCIASVINVSGENASRSSETQCDTFNDRAEAYGTSNFTNMNLGGELRQLFSNGPLTLSPKISCEAENCTFNDSKICMADTVKVKGDGADTSSGTRCETFRED